MYVCPCLCKTKKLKIGNVGTTFDEKLEYYRSKEIKPFLTDSWNYRDFEGPITCIECKQNIYPNPIDQELEMSDGLRDKIVSIVGRGYGKNGEFSVGHARTAHELVYHNKGLNFLLIYNQYRDPEKSERWLKDLAGVILLSSDVSVEKYDGVTGTPTDDAKFFCMLQFTIRPQYRHRGLAKKILDWIPSYIDHTPANVVFWASSSQSKGFFDAFGSTLAPSMVECPFNLFDDDEENRQHFYCMEIEKEKYSQSWKKDSVLSFYNDYPKNCRIRLSFQCDTLKAYYSFQETLLFHRVRAWFIRLDKKKHHTHTHTQTQTH